MLLALEKKKITAKDDELIDVRSEAENKFVGRPLGCIFVPWLDDPDWDPHPDEFIAAVKRFGTKACRHDASH
jgi:hypothetical protein